MLNTQVIAECYTKRICAIRVPCGKYIVINRFWISAFLQNTE